MCQRGITALIFDLDGTLVDTMPLHYEAYRRVLAECGVALTWDWFRRSVGGAAREVIPRLLDGHDPRQDIGTIHRRKLALVAELLQQSPPRALELAKLLPVFRSHFKLALASSGARSGVRGILRTMGWESTFDVVLTGDDVVRGKPAPDQFLLAAARLNVVPGACLVFEDTDAGVFAAEAAGMAIFDVRQAAACCASP
jgi:beta-phosphoglucomutase-like phosphatase (HAD superfamily)